VTKFTEIIYKIAARTLSVLEETKISSIAFLEWSKSLLEKI